MSSLEQHDWQKDLAKDVAAKVRDDLDSGRVPWISYGAADLGGKLVREYRNGKREFVRYEGTEVVLTPAPSRG